MIGEAPGRTEDIIGSPFVGPAGKLLDKILDEVRKETKFSYFITNIVACMPLVLKEDSWQLRPPSADEAEACSVRIVQLCRIALPKIILLIGKQAETAFDAHYSGRIDPSIKVRSIVHPAYILRKGGGKSPLFFQTVLKLRKLGEDL
jgi:DNA polymerase